MFTRSGAGVRPAVRLFAILVPCWLAVVAATPAGAIQSTPQRVSAEDAIAQVTVADGMLQFDVAENGGFFAWSGNPELVDGFPTVGTAYVTQGYIYPAGTLDGSNGVLADGSPEFPDLVIGHWSCYGWWLGDEAHAGSTAPWLNTHLFNFGPDWGAAMLTSDGYSIDELDVPLVRVLTGGTGQFAGVSGTQTETNLGYNASGGMNFRHEVHLAGWIQP